MTGLLAVPALSPDILAWLVAVTAAALGIVLHAVFPPRDPAVADALLHAAFHP